MKMRLRQGTQVRSHDGHIWRVTHVEPHSGIIELENEQGIRFHIPHPHVKAHGKKMGLIARYLHRRKKK